jgi:predicted Fe-Mo cluster-binding NifX family protein
MKIAFTTSGTNLSAPMDSRFGRAAKFLIYDTGKKNFTGIDNKGMAAAQGAGIKAAEIVVKAGAKVLVTGDCGPKAFHALKQAGVKIHLSKAATVADSLELYLAGELMEMTAA